MNSPRYLVISPVRNEEEFLQRTIDSMVAQSLHPLQWIIVDDGSADETARIAQAAARQHSWIAVVQRSDRGFRQAGGGVMDAFYDGYNLIRNHPWQFLVKLDGDLSFSPDYFRDCLRRFEMEPKLGIGGGRICKTVGGNLEPESKIDPAFHVRGATKIYRRECWEEIGGLIRAPGWDTVDEVKANMLGWTTETFTDLQLLHYRPAGEAYGQWSNLIKNGRANYVAGYHPVFMFLKCVRRFFEKPYFIGGIGLWVGFASAYFTRVPQLAEKDTIRYFRRQQMNRLLGRKNLWS